MSELQKGCRDIRAPEQMSIDMAPYRKIATNLYERYEDEIDRDSDEFNVRNERDIEAVLHNIPDDILRQYAGHGVVRGVTEENIAVAISMLANSIIIGDIAPLRTDGYPSAYTSGSFFVISHKGGFKGPGGGGPERVHIKIDGKDVGGIRVKVGAFVCNLNLDSLVEPLREMFPDAKILHASELLNYINEQEGKEN